MEQDNRLNLLCVTGVKSSVLQQAAGGSRPSSRLPKVSSLLQLRMTPMSLGWGWGAGTSVKLRSEASPVGFCLCPEGFCHPYGFLAWVLLISFCLGEQSSVDAF